MKDNISNRIVSKIEGLAPAMILEQAIAEVDGAIEEVRGELGNVIAQKYHITKAIAKLNTEHGELDERIGLANSQGRSDLVETGISRQLDIEDQLPALENQLVERGELENELNAAITGLIAKRNEMEDELFEFRASEQRKESAGFAEGEGQQSGAAAKAQAAENAFTRTLQNATGVRRSQIQASTEESAKLMELAQLNKKARIEARLKSLQAKQ